MSEVMPSYTSVTVNYVPVAAKQILFNKNVVFRVNFFFLAVLGGSTMSATELS
jgi:hypothetical protein